LKAYSCFKGDFFLLIEFKIIEIHIYKIKELKCFCFCVFDKIYFGESGPFSAAVDLMTQYFEHLVE
jgi:hypothetical protein